MPDEPETTGSENPSDTPEFEPIISQAEFDKRTKARVARATAKYADYDQLKADSAELAQLRQANLSEADKQSERIRSLEAELHNERHNNLRRDVAAAKGVPAERITGATREELEASADELLAFISERVNAAPAKPRPPVGKSGASSTDSRMDPKERAAAALRNWRGTA